jgi:anthranilate phosphoribosyltransferase
VTDVTDPDIAARDRADLDALGGWPGVLTRLMDGQDLTSAEAATAMGVILSGGASPAQLIAFAVALRVKGETAQELSGMLDAVLGAAELIPLSDQMRATAIDVVGTGGDRSHSVNVSTMTALVVAGAGVPVAKHGNRGASSQCGTADVLEQLGVAIELGPDGVARCLDEAGIGFCFAPRFHPAFRHAGPARREVGVPLVFNLLGPMANPGRVRRHLIGVADGRFAERMLVALRDHGSTDAWVVHGGGLDELTTTGPSTVLALGEGGEPQAFTIDPAELGFAPARREDLVGGDKSHNADVVRRVVGGDPGPHRDIVVLNAAASLVVAGTVPSLAAGVEAASASIDSGNAAATLDAFIAVSQAAASAAAPA